MTTPLLTAVCTTPANPIEDVSPEPIHPFVMQARTFMRNGTHPYNFYRAVAQNLPKVIGVASKDAMLLLEAVETRYISLVSNEFNAANTARANGDTKATKPADMYRKYQHDLRAIWKRNGLMSIPAHGLLTDMMLEQTQAWGELDNPDYIDAYTGEKIEEEIPEDRDLEILVEGLDEELREGTTPRNRGAKLLLKALAHMFLEQPKKTLPLTSMQRELLEQAEQCRKDLGWGDKEVEAFLKINMGGYDSESDEIELPDDDTDAHTPDTLLERDLVMDRSLYFGARSEVVEFNKARREIFERMDILKVPYAKRPSEFRILLTASDAYDALLNTIRNVAKENAVTAGVIYLSVAGEYGLTRDDIKGIRGWHSDVVGKSAISVNLPDFVEEWEEDLLNLQQDSLHNSFPTSEKEIEEASISALNAVSETMPELDPNPVKTRSWNNAFVLAVLGGAELKAAEDAAWAGWREAMDPKAAAEYNKVFAANGNRKAAMRAFWQICDKRVPRPQDNIASIKRKGLKLENDRVIHWGIVAIKLKNNELNISGDIASRLLAKLKELNVGKNVWALLEGK